MAADYRELQEPLNVDQAVDLIEYLHALLRSKYRIVLVAILAAGLVFGLSKMIVDKYTATTILGININTEPGGVDPTAYRGSDTVGLLEHDFILDVVPANEVDRLLARLGAYPFVVSFIEKNELLPLIFSDEWDSVNGQWKEDFEPDLRVAVKVFRTEMFNHKHDLSTGLLSISITTESAQLSTTLVNSFYSQFNQFMREMELEQLNSRREFLEQRLRVVNNVEVQRSIYRLLEAQVAVESLLYARDNYPLEPIELATVPLFKSSPARKKWAVLAFFVFLFLGIFFVIAMVVLGKLRAALKGYDKPTQTLAAQNDQNQEWVE